MMFTLSHFYLSLTNSGLSTAFCAGEVDLSAALENLMNARECFR